MAPRTRHRAAVLLATVVVVIGGTAPAVAAPTPTPAPTPAVTAGPAAGDPALIDPDARTTLHVTVYEGAPGDPGTYPADGTQRDQSRPTVAGAGFQISRVCVAGTATPVDLTTDAGWEQAAAYQADVASAAANRCDAGPAQAAATDAAGTLTFSGLPVGLYHVAQVDAPAGYTTSAPFVVTLPMTDPTDRSSWRYESGPTPRAPSTRSRRPWPTAGPRAPTRRPATV